MITSRDNEKLKLVRKLHERRWRDKLGLFVAEGEDLVDAATAAGVGPVELLVAGENVEPALLAEVSELGHPPRVVGVFRRDDLRRAEVPPSGLALWRVADPGNVGTLIRSADAFGPAFVAVSSGSADPTGPKALRASMGAVFRVPVVDFDQSPRPWIALVPRGGTPLTGLSDLASGTFVLGAERAGLPDEVLVRCDEQATVPLTGGAESLNVAMAGTIALYERRRRETARNIAAPSDERVSTWAEDFAQGYDEWSRGLTTDIQLYVDLAREAPEGVIVELAVGDGRVAIPVAAATGRRVVGVDTSPTMLQRARERAEQAGVELDLREADMRDLDLDEPAALIYCPFRALFHLSTWADRRRLFERVAACLAPDGRFVWDAWALDHRSAAQDDGARRERPVPHTLRYAVGDNRLDLVLDNGSKSSMWWATKNEWLGLVDVAGLEVEALYGSYEREPFDEDSGLYVFVARRRRA